MHVCFLYSLSLLTFFTCWIWSKWPWNTISLSCSVIWIFCSSDHSEFCCSWKRSWRDLRGMEVVTGVVSKVFICLQLLLTGILTLWDTVLWLISTCPHKPVCVSPAVAHRSADRCNGRFSLFSAAWLTSVMQFIGCRPASCGRDDSPIGWWGCWVPSRLWLVWSRWAQATVARQTVHSLHLAAINHSGALMTWKMLFVEKAEWKDVWQIFNVIRLQSACLWRLI